jgi:phosphate-selective porin
MKGRFAWVDMNQIEDKSFAGGNQVSSTIGANWYWNNWSRFMLDWTHVYSLNVGQAGINRTVLDVPGQNTGDWDVVQARIDLHY